jgi:ribosomal protein L11 methylase PrmA
MYYLFVLFLSYLFVRGNSLSLERRGVGVGRSIQFNDVTVISTPHGGNDDQVNRNPNEIILTETKSGWGTGEHPTTSLCIEFIQKRVQPGMKVLDYGTGSAILAILAAKQGAEKVTAVDIDELTLDVAQQNVALNACESTVDVLHTRFVYAGNTNIPLADVTVANILPGPLTRLVSPIYAFTKAGGYICLSGMRPEELTAVREFYKDIIEEDTEETTILSHDSFGDWVAYSAQVKMMDEKERKDKINALSSAAAE